MQVVLTFFFFVFINTFFLPGWRCNALHTQMYMLEGLSRWNINRAQQALNMSVTSQTRIYGVRLMSSVNALSNRVLGSALLQEFTPPGKPTGKILMATKEQMLNNILLVPNCQIMMVTLTLSTSILFFLVTTYGR